MCHRFVPLGGKVVMLRLDEGLMIDSDGHKKTETRDPERDVNKKAYTEVWACGHVDSSE